MCMFISNWKCLKPFYGFCLIHTFSTQLWKGSDFKLNNTPFSLFRILQTSVSKASGAKVSIFSYFCRAHNLRAPKWYSGYLDRFHSWKVESFLRYIQLVYCTIRLLSPVIHIYWWDMKERKCFDKWTKSMKIHRSIFTGTFT